MRVSLSSARMAASNHGPDQRGYNLSSAPNAQETEISQ
jgi:hypothetical protein